MNENIEILGRYSIDSNPAVNKDKTKWMLVSTPQLDRVHSLDEKQLFLSYNGSNLERIRVKKLLGVYMDNHLLWNEHVVMTLSSCYSTLAVLRKFRHTAPLQIRKQLIECLNFSKLDYCSLVLNYLPVYQVKRLQRLQNACAAFVLGKYANMNEVLKFRWLPVHERRELNLLKLVHKSLYVTVPEKLTPVF
ncbi:Hypothetical predicted protein [Paramuricea clavata]|uniref:Uncharacterized protein n=1 Tax=Paramuricea clavata TaxID=317549 RepID=A0A7D9DW63_PARCT|nr:Hypothetical predicted protein [Paramuricea clavata]